MSTLRVSKSTHEDYVRRLKENGERGLFCFVVEQGIAAKAVFKNPDVDVLNQSDAFFKLFRNTGQEVYFTIGRVLRRAAHHLYREFQSKDKKRPINLRFLNIINGRY